MNREQLATMIWDNQQVLDYCDKIKLAGWIVAILVFIYIAYKLTRGGRK